MSYVISSGAKIEAHTELSGAQTSYLNEALGRYDNMMALVDFAALKSHSGTVPYNNPVPTNQNSIF